MEKSTCAVDGCDRPARSRGWCNTHYEYWRRRQPHPLEPRSQFGDAGPNWKGDDGGYKAVHLRLRAQFGPASDHVCSCGQPAQLWAYMHTDPSPRRSREGFPYSSDPSRYEPKCRRCHHRLDRGHAEHPAHELTEAQAREIYERRVVGREKVIKLVAEYGVSESTIRKIAGRRSWS